MLAGVGLECTFNLQYGPILYTRICYRQISFFKMCIYVHTLLFWNIISRDDQCPSLNIQSSVS